MNPKISVVMLGVQDFNRAKQFYGEGLGCPVAQEYPGFVSFNLGEGSSTLALYPWEAAADEAGMAPEGNGFRGVSLHCLVDSQERVDEVLGQAEQAGGTIVKPGRQAQWGGYFGYFSDPDGYLWKVASA